MVEDEEQMGFYPRPRTRDEASAWIDRNLSLYEEHGYGIWFIESIATSEFLVEMVRRRSIVAKRRPRLEGLWVMALGMRE